jgi:hypothetical protein
MSHRPPRRLPSRISIENHEGSPRPAGDFDGLHKATTQATPPLERVLSDGYGSTHSVADNELQKW